MKLLFFHFYYKKTKERKKERKKQQKKKQTKQREICECWTEPNKVNKVFPSPRVYYPYCSWERNASFSAGLSAVVVSSQAAEAAANVTPDTKEKRKTKKKKKKKKRNLLRGDRGRVTSRKVAHVFPSTGTAGGLDNASEASKSAQLK